MCWHVFWVLVCYCLYSSWWVRVCVCVVAVSPSHCAFAAGGGRAQLMSLSAAGWAWKRPFVGSCSTSSPCASDTHSHRGQGRGMAPFRLPYCPLNWHIYKSNKTLDQTHAFGSLYLSKVGLTKSPKKQRGKKKKHGDARKRKLVDFARQRTLSVSEKSEKKKGIYSN